MPSNGVLIAYVTMYAVPTHAKLSKALNCPVIVGRAVAIIEVSRFASITARARAPRTIPKRLLVNPGTKVSVAMVSPYPLVGAWGHAERMPSGVSSSIAL